MISICCNTFNSFFTFCLLQVIAKVQNIWNLIRWEECNIAEMKSDTEQNDEVGVVVQSWLGVQVELMVW